MPSDSFRDKYGLASSRLSSIYTAQLSSDLPSSQQQTTISSLYNHQLQPQYTIGTITTTFHLPFPLNYHHSSTTTPPQLLPIPYNLSFTTIKTISPKHQLQIQLQQTSIIIQVFGVSTSLSLRKLITRQPFSLLSASVIQHGSPDRLQRLSPKDRAQ